MAEETLSFSRMVPLSMNDAEPAPNIPKGTLMAGKRGLIMGVANDRSIAWGIAQAIAAQGGEVAFTYQGEALEKRVRPLAESLGSSLVVPCDTMDDLVNLMGDAQKPDSALIRESQPRGSRARVFEYELGDIKAQEILRYIRSRMCRLPTPYRAWNRRLLDRYFFQSLHSVRFQILGQHTPRDVNRHHNINPFCGLGFVANIYRSGSCHGYN
jgi:hypothetical protein